MTDAERQEAIRLADYLYGYGRAKDDAEIMSAASILKNLANQDRNAVGHSAS